MHPTGTTLGVLVSVKSKIHVKEARVNINVKYATVCKQSLKALLVAFEFYSPIFIRLPVCEWLSALSQLIVGVCSLRVSFFRW